MSAQGPLSADQGSDAGQMYSWCSLATEATGRGDRPALSPSLGHARPRSVQPLRPPMSRVSGRADAPGLSWRAPKVASAIICPEGPSPIRHDQGTIQGRGAIKADQGSRRAPCRLRPRSMMAAAEGVPAASRGWTATPVPRSTTPMAGSRTKDSRWQVRAAASRLGRDDSCPRIGPPHASPARRRLARLPARLPARGCLVHDGNGAGLCRPASPACLPRSASCRPGRRLPCAMRPAVSAMSAGPSGSRMPPLTRHPVGWTSWPSASGTWTWPMRPPSATCRTCSSWARPSRLSGPARTSSCASCSIARSTPSRRDTPASTWPPTATARAATTHRRVWGRASSPSPAARTWPA